MAVLSRRLLLVLLVGAGCFDREGFKKNPDFLVIGHRGAPRVEAENTLASMETALMLGANAVEIDLNVTSDGVIVVWHDRDPDDTVAVARQAGLEQLLVVPLVPPDSSPFHRPVDELTLADFLATHGYSLDGDTRDPDAPIMLFDEFLAWADKAGDLDAVYLDVKPIQPAQAVAIMQAVDDSGLSSRVRFIFISPNLEIVQALIAERARLGADDLRIARDYEGGGSLAGAEEVGLRDVSTGLTPVRSETLFLDEVDELVEARKDKRLDTVTVWTIDRRQLLGQLLFRGVDGIMTNDPALLHELWQLTL